ncbi:MAG: hypothetical protein K0S71_2717 [Clostridia bacterium]|jgi:hypothetical protein|nr:hypothetical protein [Clostridia bacterium]
MLDAKDPYLLLSIVNMKLRDESDTLQDLCLTYDKNIEDIISRLKAIDYEYDAKLNQFISK